MKKILSFILGSIFALNLSISVANSAANEVRVAYFLEWPSPNLEDMQKKNFAKALGVPVKWTNFTNGGAMTDAMLAGDIDISYSQGLVPFINAVKSNAPIKLVDIAMEYGMGGTTCVTSNASGITKANATELEGKKLVSTFPLGVPIPFKNASRFPLVIDCLVSVGVKNLKPLKVSFISPTFISEALDIEFMSLLPALYLALAS